MTTKRYYYQCPIKATYMAKEFGMRFDDSFYVMCDYIIHEGENLGALIKINAPPKIYIHPDSLHLLKPQEGDLIEDPCEPNHFIFISHDESWPLHKEFESGWFKIIQRNGKAFMWPEVEA